jgi:hypothetical protein
VIDEQKLLQLLQNQQTQINMLNEQLKIITDVVKNLNDLFRTK